MSKRLSRYAGLMIIAVVLPMTVLASFEIIHFPDSTLRILLKWAVILLLGWEGARTVKQYQDRGAYRDDNPNDPDRRWERPSDYEDRSGGGPAPNTRNDEQTNTHTDADTNTNTNTNTTNDGNVDGGNTDDGRSNARSDRYEHDDRR